jgi:hypothetical protein
MWAIFFITAAGASTALAALIFVALSVNISRIINLVEIVGRAKSATQYRKA